MVLVFYHHEGHEDHEEINYMIFALPDNDIRVEDRSTAFLA